MVRSVNCDTEPSADQQTDKIFGSNIIVIINIFAMSKPGGSYVGLTTTAHSQGDTSRTSGSYYISFDNSVCVVVSYSVIDCFGLSCSNNSKPENRPGRAVPRRDTKARRPRKHRSTAHLI